MVPAIYTTYFTAAASSAAALIGLLFVAISLRPDSIFSEGAPPSGRALAGSAFIALVNAFLISILALIPATNLGATASFTAVVSLGATVNLHRRIARRESHVLLLAGSCATYLVQLSVGVALIVKPHERSLVTDVCFVTIASFVVALLRAWLLLQGRHVTAREPVEASATSQA